jgi:hypothetical protein
MNKISKKIYSAFALTFFIVSCNTTNKNDDTTMSFIQTETKTKTEDTVIKQSYSDMQEISEEMQEQEELTEIDTVLQKMYEQKKLTEADYAIICNILPYADASLAESIGGSLFNYLKNNRLNNASFLSYLDKKEALFKEKTLYELVFIMCLDIQDEKYLDEKYSYDIFIKNFDMFKNSVSAKEAFDKCMNN